MRWQVLVAFVVILSQCVFSVEHSNFKRCNEAGFCKRQRDHGPTKYVVDPSSVSVAQGKLFAKLTNEAHVSFNLEILLSTRSMGRLRITETTPLVPRYEVQDVIVNNLEAASKIKVSNIGATEASVSLEDGLKVRVAYDPFHVEWLQGDDVVISVNDRQLLNFEHSRRKPEIPQLPPAPTPVEGEEAPEEDSETIANRALDAQHKHEESLGMWSENFKGAHDSKPRGPQSIGMDFTFVGAKHVYGIPEHATSFSLKNTRVDGYNEPYRLFNLDVFEYELDSPMALYGTVPLLIAHSAARTSAVFWLNAAETWVDIAPGSEGRQSHWMSETGIIDVFFLFGPRPQDVTRQYAFLTGPAQLPQYFAIAYHQCRWNYRDEEDVRTVDTMFDEHQIPYDVLWLDIEHTNGKRYFTWDPIKFPTPEKMLEGVASKGRKMVTIIDPHIKRDSGYHVHSEAESRGHYVKKSDSSTDYDGHCWPGSSSWLDMTDPEVRDFWRDKFALDVYKGSTQHLYTWNDMNEPSVFSGPEITMHKDALHEGGWEHRDVHNLYGFYFHWATYEGLRHRGTGTDRPFVLSRSFYSGTQRFGAIWTGDNRADWGHLAASVPMLLSHSIAGITFIGADVGGFFTDPSPQLLVRWYQLGAFTPFFRAHAHLDTKRREPWLFGEDNTDLIRDAVRRRYTWLPYFYTVFEEASRTLEPVMRPLWYEFPAEEALYAVDHVFLVGADLLVVPVTSADTTSVTAYFPGTEMWYDVETGAGLPGGETHTVAAPLNKIPVFQRSGSVLPRKDRPRRNSAAMGRDPFTLYVAVDSQGRADGELYLDDGHSFAFKDGVFLRREFSFADGKLSNKPSSDYAGSYVTEERLERVVVAGLARRPSQVTLSIRGQQHDLEFTVLTDGRVVVRHPKVLISADWQIAFK